MHSAGVEEVEGGSYGVSAVDRGAGARRVSMLDCPS